MSTFLQEKLAGEIATNLKRKKPLNQTTLLSKVEYAETTANHNQKRTLTAKGVINALEKYGFSSDIAKKRIGEMLLAKNTKQDILIKASQEVFKVNGDYAPVKAESVNANIELNSLSDDELAKIAYNEPIELKEKQEIDLQGLLKEKADE